MKYAEIYLCILFFLIVVIFILIFFTISGSKLNKELNNILQKTSRKQREDLEFYNKNLEKVKKSYEEQLNNVKNKLGVYQTNLEKVKCDYEEQLKEVKKNYEEQLNNVQNKFDVYRTSLDNLLKSNITSAPWLAGMVADFLTLPYERLAKSLDWGSDVKRAKKVKDIREIRAEAKAQIEQYKEASYHLSFLLQIYPELDDLICSDYKEIQSEVQKLPTSPALEKDPVKNYLNDEEWSNLSTTEKNQLALDRYIESCRKTKWQIGRDYEMSVAYQLRKEGYDVDPTGIENRFEDLGRDIIAKKDGKTSIIQCKYWSAKKEIHEKHIFQLYGTTVMYCLENKLKLGSVDAIIFTNTRYSDTAQKVAKILNIKLIENNELINFPRIKCNINTRDGIETKIYHLPMDRMYDVTKIDKKGEFYAFTVKEAESKGFRRSYKWHGN